METPTNAESFSQPSYPPKPEILIRPQNALRRSIISLLIYGVLFYFLFDRNVAYIAAILIVILVHDLGHFLMMRLFNYANPRLFVLPLLGAYTPGHGQRVSQLQLALIILAGPVPGILTGSILLLLKNPTENDTITMLANSFLIINLLNLLPFYPLDGGRLLETLFFREQSTIRMVFGILSIAAMTIFFLLLLNPILLIVPAFIGLDLYNERKHQKIREYLAQEGIPYRIDYSRLSDRNYWLIRDCLLLSFPKKYAGISAGQYEYSALEPALLQQVSAVLQTDIQPELRAPGKLALLLFYLLAFAIPVGLMWVYK